MSSSAKDSAKGSAIACKEILIRNNDGEYQWVKVPLEALQQKTPVKQTKSGLFVRGAYGEGKPLVSQSLGCHSSQVEDFNRRLKEAGISGARHRPDGTLEITSRTARNQVMRLRGAKDLDGGYGDHC